jgi:TP901 family phage tail tape measure protein
MAITARELVFYIRAEDQASRVVKRAAANMRGMTNLRGLQTQIDKSNLQNIQKIQAARDAVTAGELAGTQKIAAAEQALHDTRIKNLDKIGARQQALRRNLTSVQKAEDALAVTPRTIAGKTPMGAYTRVANPQWQIAAENLATLNRETELLQGKLAEVERSSTAASAAMERNLRAVEEQAVQTNAVLREAQTAATQLAYEEKAANDRLMAQQRLIRTSEIITGFQSAARAVRLFGLAAGASLAYAAHKAASFQTELTLAASQARPSGAGAAATARISGRLQNVVLAQMQKFPAASQDMADSLYQIFSSTKIQGIPQATKLLTLFNQAAVAGGTDLKSMTDAGITLLNNFVGTNNEFKTLNPAMERFFAAVRFGRMNAGQFAGSLSYVAGMAKEAGLGFTDVADAMAVLTRQTGARGTTRDAQGLGRLIQQFANPDAIEGMKQLGIQAIDPLTMKMKPLLNIIGQIKQKADLRGVNALNFFKTITALGGDGKGNKGTVQAQRAFAFLINNFKEYQTVSKQVNSDNNELDQSFKALSKSPGVAWQIMLNQIKAAVIVVGREAIPAFIRLGKPIVQLLHWFNGLSEGTKKTIAVWGVFGSAAAVIGGTIAVLAGSILKLVINVKALNIAKLGEETGSATAKFSIWLTVIVAIVAAFIHWHKQAMQVVNALGGLKNVVTMIGTALTAWGLLKLVTGLGKVATAAQVATKEVGLLRLMLLSIQRMGPIAVAIVVTEIFTHKGAIDKWISHQIDKLPSWMGGGGTNKMSWSDVVKKAGPDFKSSGIGGDFSRQIISDMQKTVKTVTPKLSDLKQMAKAGDTDAAKLLRTYYYASAFLNRAYGKSVGVAEVIPKRTDQSIRKGAADIRGMATAAATATTHTATLTANWNKLWEKVVSLDKVIKGEKMPSRGELQKLLDAQDALQKASKGNQYAAAMEYLSALEQGWTKTSKAAEKAAKSMDKGAASQIDSYIDVVVKLKKAYDLSGTLADAKKYQAGMDQLNKLYASDASQMYINDRISKLTDTSTVVDKASDKLIDSRIKAVAKLQKAYSLHGTLTNARAYFAALDKLNTDYASEASQDYISKYLDKVNNADKKRLDLMKQNKQNAISQQKDLVSGIQQIYDNFLQQNQQNMGDLFQGPWMQGRMVQTGIQFGFAPRGVDILKDAKAQLFQFRRFNSDLDKLRKRGAPKAMIDAFRAMGPSEKANIEALIKLHPAKWDEYVRTWNARQHIIKTTTMKQLNAQLTIYESHGKKIANAIIRGIKSENVKLTGVFEQMIRKMFPGLERQANPHGGGGGTQNVNQPRKVADHLHFHFNGKGVSADDKAAVKKVLFRLQNG